MKVLHKLSILAIGTGLVILNYSQPAQAGLRFGQDQSYDVILRDNGKAVVTVRIGITNPSDKNISSLEYIQETGTLGEVVGFQEISCQALPIVAPLLAEDTTLSSQAGAANKARTTIKTPQYPECYPTYTTSSTSSSESSARAPTNNSQSQLFYPGSLQIYKKITVTKSNKGFELKLPQPISTGEESTAILLYDVQGVSSKSMGVYDFAFQTLKSDYLIDGVNVAIDVDESYVIEDGIGSKVSYKDTASSGSDLSATLGSGASLDASQAVEIKEYIEKIGGYGSIQKQASRLGAGETLTVKGSFATSEIWFDLPRYILIAISSIALIGLCVYLYGKRRQKLLKQASWADTTSQPVDKIDDDHVTSAEEDRPPEPQDQLGDSPKAQDVVVAAPITSTENASLRALPFYDSAASFKQALQQRRIRPMFVGWLLTLAAAGLITSLMIGFSLLNSVASTSSDPDSSSILVGILLFALAIVGFLAFLMIIIVLPLQYAGSFRRAIPIFVHITLAMLVLLIAYSSFVLWLNNSEPTGDYAPGLCRGCIVN